jgi:hypothetical protein
MVCLPPSRHDVRYQEFLWYSSCGTLLRIGRYLCVRFLLLKSRLFSNNAWSQKLYRRKGSPNRATTVIFVATVLNFLLFRMVTGIEAAEVSVFIRMALIVDIDYRLSEKGELIDSALQNMNIAIFWTGSIPVNVKLSLSDPVSIHTRRRCCSAISLSFGELGPSFQIDSG